MSADRELHPGNHADRLIALDGKPELQREYMEEVPESMKATVRTCYRYGKILDRKLALIRSNSRGRA